jgi:heavy metal sensor kinase
VNLAFKGLSLRYRLTAWYALALALVLSIVAIGGRVAMEASVYQTLDNSLRIRARSISQFLEGNALDAPGDFDDELRIEGGRGLGGGMFRICGSSGSSASGHETVYQSADLNQLLLPPCPNSAGSVETIQTTRLGRRLTRVASLPLVSHERIFTIQVFQSLHDIHESFERFDAMMWIGVPVLLALASFGGFWMSRKALAPVDRITQDARSISIANLSERLEVSGSKDELHRLTETLNDMLARLDSSVRQMRQFTADASHELRTPLTLIRTAAEFSLRRERTREELTEAIRKILRECERTSTLVDSLLLLARADSGVDGLQFAPVDLCDLVRDACDQARILAGPKQIEVRAEIPESNIELIADEHALRRVLLIFLDNAVKYTPSGGVVSLRASIKDGEALVTVKDTGIGISAEDLPHVFDRFWRADKVRSREMGGAGLGLSIARWISERHGGTVTARSEPEMGSTFELRIPCAKLTGPGAGLVEPAYPSSISQGRPA